MVDLGVSSRAHAQKHPERVIKSNKEQAEKAKEDPDKQIKRFRHEACDLNLHVFAA